MKPKLLDASPFDNPEQPDGSTKLFTVKSGSLLGSGPLWYPDKSGKPRVSLIVYEPDDKPINKT